MNHRFRRNAWLPALVLTGLLAACGDDDGTTVVTDYDPQETLGHLDEVVAGLDLGDPVLDGFLNLTEYFYGYAAAPALAATRTAAAVSLGGTLAGADRLRARGPQRLAGAGEGALPRLVLPSAVIGETLVWDPVDGYVVDPGGSGAPTQGVRVIYYVTGADDYPSLPLTPLGYIDITDQDGGVVERVGVRVVEYGAGSAQDRELADYAIELALSGSSASGTAEIGVTGTVAGAGAEIDLDMVQRVTWNETQDFYGLVMDYLFTTPEGPVSFAVEAEGPLTTDEWDLLLFDIEFDTSGSSRVELQMQIDQAGRLDGEIRQGGRLAIEVSGVDGDPEFQRAGGADLTGSDIAALELIWIGISDVISLTEWLILPVDLLYLAG